MPTDHGTSSTSTAASATAETNGNGHRPKPTDPALWVNIEHAEKLGIDRTWEMFQLLNFDHAEFQRLRDLMEPITDRKIDDKTRVQAFPVLPGVSVTAMSERNVVVTREEAERFAEKNGVDDPHVIAGRMTKHRSAHQEAMRRRVADMFDGAPILPGSGSDLLPNYPSNGLAGSYADMAREISRVTHEGEGAQHGPDLDLVMSATVLDTIFATVVQPGAVIRDRNANFVEPLTAQVVISTGIGGGKTPTLKQALNPLKRIEKREKASAAKRHMEQAAKRALAVKRAEEARKEATKKRKAHDDWIAKNNKVDVMKPPVDDPAPAGPEKDDRAAAVFEKDDRAADVVKEAVGIVAAKEDDELAKLRRAAEQHESLAIELTRAAQEIAVVSPADMYTADVTAQHLRDLLVANNGNVALITDEAATTFSNLMGRSAGQNGTADWTALVSGYNAGDQRGGRVGSGSFDVDGIRVTVCLMIQPDRLREPLADQAANDQGVWARICAVHQRRHDLHYPHPALDERIASAYSNDLIDLHTALTKRVAENGGVQMELELSDQAQQIFTDRVRALNTRINAGGDLSRGPIAEWLTKQAPRVLRVAGRRHLMKHGAAGLDRPVDAETMTAAWDVGDFYLAHARWTFDQASTEAVPDVDRIHKVIEFIRKKRAPYSSIRKRLLTNSGPLRAEPAPKLREEGTLEVMERLNLIVQKKQDKGSFDVYLHPDLDD